MTQEEWAALVAHITHEGMVEFTELAMRNEANKSMIQDIGDAIAAFIRGVPESDIWDGLAHAPAPSQQLIEFWERTGGQHQVERRQ